MFARLTTIIGVLGVAALGTWIKAKRRNRQEPDDLPSPLPAIPSVYIDDDEAAEIIRRAGPALERARTIDEP
jgi:hypothetical protein